MSAPSDRKSLIVIFSVLTFIVCGTYLLIFLGRGYRLNFTSQPRLESTGLLSLVSTPKAASVYIDGRLTTATDDTVNLLPGQYNLKISKDGYLPWSKTVSIYRELVTPADVYLYRVAPDLKPITVSGAINLATSPDGTRMVYAVASASAARENGLFLLETGDNPLNLNRFQTRRLSAPLPQANWSDFTFTFSPNSNEILARSAANNYLFTLSGPANQDQVFDITTQLDLIFAGWQTQSTQLATQATSRLPQFLRSQIATDSAGSVKISSTGDYILYQATANSTLANPTHFPLPTLAASTNSLTGGNIYVYHAITGNNFPLNLSGYSRYFWLNNTPNIILVKDGEIAVIDADGSNLHPLFKGNFTSSQVTQSADGSQLIVLTSPYPGASTNLYAVSIR